MKEGCIIINQELYDNIDNWIKTSNYQGKSLNTYAGNYLAKTYDLTKHKNYTSNPANAKQIVSKLCDLIDTPLSELSADNSTLQILTLLTADVLENIQIYKSKEFQIYNVLSSIKKMHLNPRLTTINLTQEEIRAFFHHYFNFRNIWVNFKYKNEKEKEETIDYMEELIRTFKYWDVIYGQPDCPSDYAKYIRKFALALYDKNELPDIDIFIDQLEYYGAPDTLYEEFDSSHFH